MKNVDAVPAKRMWQIVPAEPAGKNISSMPRFYLYNNLSTFFMKCWGYLSESP
jgi:hypothetical protein